MVCHGVPEEVTQCFTVFISCQLIITGFCQYLRYKRVRMFRAQIIILLFQRVYHIIMIEKMRQPTVTFVTGSGIQIIE